LGANSDGIRMVKAIVFRDAQKDFK